jgi:hypothetical protein
MWGKEFQRVPESSTAFFLLAVDAEVNQEKKPNDEELFFICKLSAMIY